MFLSKVEIGLLNYLQLSEFQRDHTIGLMCRTRASRNYLMELFVVGETGQRKVGTFGIVALDNLE